VIPSAGAAEPTYQPDNPNSDMGGNDFGMGGDSWDSGGSGGGGGDWGDSGGGGGSDWS
jgi:hypothetical protein